MNLHLLMLAILANVVGVIGTAYLLSRRIDRVASQAREMRAKTLEFAETLVRDLAAGVVSSDTAICALRGAVHQLNCAITAGGRNARPHQRTVEQQLRIVDDAASDRRATAELLDVLNEKVAR
jgi:hypothetical protein